jgi:DNA-binding XRE family transcriptional regulator
MWEAVTDSGYSFSFLEEPEHFDRHYIASQCAEFGDPEDDHTRPTPTPRETIQAIQKGRDKRGWTQKDLAKKMNVPASTVTCIESGAGLYDTSMISFIWRVFDENPPPPTPPKREETPPPLPLQSIVKKPLHQGKSKAVVPDDLFVTIKKKQHKQVSKKKK